ncbi:MAG: HAMP domain-containing sensor histidine kinase [Myxococcota bacterium]
MARWIALSLLVISTLNYGVILAVLERAGSTLAWNALFQLGLLSALALALRGLGSLAGAFIITLNTLAVFGVLLLEHGGFAPPAYLLVVGTLVGTWTLPRGWLVATTVGLAVGCPALLKILFDLKPGDVESIVLLTVLIVVTGATGSVGASEWRRLYAVDEARRQALDAASLYAAQMAAEREAQSAFLTSMSHELRTPLNAILGYVELVAEEIADLAPDSVADLERVGVAGRHLRRLIDDVLDLSKLEAGKLVVDDAIVAIGPLLDEVADASRTLAKARGNVLIVDIPAVVRVRGDELRLRQVLLNLVSNSAKFTADGTITLRAVRAHHGVVVSVSDTGCGMTAAELEQAFRRFGQNPHDAPAEGGTGLGLTIARELTLAMGGSLEASSAPGIGTTMALRLQSAERPSNLS